MNVVDNSLNTLNEAAFIVTKQGLIVFCNTPGIKMFGYKNFNEICNLRVKDLVPDDFAAIFPDIITIEHLTKGEYLGRVNKKKNGSLFATEILTYYKYIGNIEYVYVHIRIPITDEELEKRRLKQNIEVLKCELEKERNKKDQINSSNKKTTYNIAQFSFNIRKEFPKLTSTDLKLCTLIIHNLSTKEIAESLNISLDGAFAGRKRLRKKLNINSSISLSSFLQSFLV